MSNTGIGGSYREMLDDYRDVDIDELMKGLVHIFLQKSYKAGRLFPMVI